MSPVLSHMVVVAIPAYNEERFIAEALTSLTRQRCQNFNVLVSDNCSEDRTGEICRAVARADARFAYYRQPENLGSARNFEWLLRNTSSEYFMWLGAHDLLAPDYLEKALAALQSAPDASLCFSDTLMIDEAGFAIKRKDGGSYHLAPGNNAERYRRVFSRIGPCEPINNLFRRSALEGAALPPVASIDKMIMCHAAFHGRFVKVPEPLYIRRDLTARGGGSRARLVRVTGSPASRVSRLATISEFRRQYAKLDPSLRGRAKFAVRLLAKYSRYIAKDMLKALGLKSRN